MHPPRRILLKLSGEMLGGVGASGIEAGRLRWLSDEIGAARQFGAQVAVVVGAGNFVRGAAMAGSGVGRVTADYMGMLGTVINALALADALASRGIPAKALSAIPMRPAAEAYTRAAAMAALDQGVTTVFGGGTGNPYFTTDTAASLRAVEVGADVLAKGTKVPGVYDKDPAVHPDATPYGTISYDEALSRRLGFMDATAVAMCRDNGLPVVVFAMDDQGALGRIARGETPGTLMA